MKIFIYFLIFFEFFFCLIIEFSKFDEHVLLKAAAKVTLFHVPTQC
jgi:hypothetical protein